MESFRLIAVVYSMLLSLGVTRLFSGLIVVFRSRTHSKLDWIPLAWAACVFVWQLQFWWAIVELSHLVEVWTLGEFVLMVVLTLLLFVSAALVLPTDRLEPAESLYDVFERDGRWALASMSAYSALALLVDWIFWDVVPGSTATLLLVPLTLLPMVFLRLKRRLTQEIVTVLYAALCIWMAMSFSPDYYR